MMESEIVNRDLEQIIIDDYARYLITERIKLKEAAYEMYTKFSPENLEEYKNLLSAFIQHQDENEKGITQAKLKDKQINTLDIGNLLENLVTFIFSKLPIFKISGKVDTNTNEIDHVIELSFEGKALKGDNLIDMSQNYFIGESKNYNHTIGVTWVNKLYSLMSSSCTRLGLIFSYHGLTGSDSCGGWQNAKGFTKKILLSSLGSLGPGADRSSGTYIIDFNFKHFKELAEGKSIIEIIEHEQKLMVLDVRGDYNSSEVHDRQSEIKEIITSVCS